MHINDFYYEDLHKKNICFVKTNIKTIKILNLDIPTYNYIYSIIDYEGVVSYKFNDRIYNLIKSRYNGYIRFLLDGIFDYEDKLMKLVYKIFNNDKSIVNDKNFYLFETSLLNYEQTKNYIKYINNAPKLIKYLYKELNKL